MPYSTAPGENLSRFIVDRRQIHSSDNTVKYLAFLPPNDGRLSVYRTTALDENLIWELGDTFVAPARGKPILARADINSLLAYAQELEVESVPDPHVRHAEIFGWDPERTKVRLQAQKLANAAGGAIFPA